MLKPPPNRPLADTIGLVHFLWVAIALANLPLLFVYSWWYWLVLAFALGTYAQSLIFNGCLLAKLENRFRALGDPERIPEGQGYLQHLINRSFGVNWSRAFVGRIADAYLGAALFIAAIEFLAARHLLGF